MNRITKILINNKESKIKKMIKNNEIDLKIKDEDNSTVLMYASRYINDKDIIDLLIDLGENVNEVDDNGSTALMYAAMNNNVEIIKTLIENGANINQKDKIDSTALIYAARYNQNPESIKVLIENGADVTIKDIDENTAFYYANKNRYLNTEKSNVISLLNNNISEN